MGVILKASSLITVSITPSPQPTINTLPLRLPDVSQADAPNPRKRKRNAARKNAGRRKRDEERALSATGSTRTTREDRARRDRHHGGSVFSDQETENDTQLRHKKAQRLRSISVAVDLEVSSPRTKPGFVGMKDLGEEEPSANPQEEVVETAIPVTSQMQPLLAYLLRAGYGYSASDIMYVNSTHIWLRLVTILV